MVEHPEEHLAREVVGIGGTQAPEIAPDPSGQLFVELLERPWLARDRSREDPIEGVLPALVVAQRRGGTSRG
jgi:hypothetical protein